MALIKVECFENTLRSKYYITFTRYKDIEKFVVDYCRPSQRGLEYLIPCSFVINIFGCDPFEQLDIDKSYKLLVSVIKHYIEEGVNMLSLISKVAEHVYYYNYNAIGGLQKA